MSSSAEICGKLDDKVASLSRYGSVDTALSIKQATGENINTTLLPVVPPKPKVRQRILNKQLNKTPESSSSQLQQDQTSTKESGRTFDTNKQANGQKSDAEREAITLNYYHAEGPTCYDSLDANQLRTNKESICLPLPSNQQVASTSSKDSTTRKYPLQVFFIVANEFCERFSFYGFRTILVLYFKTVLGFSDSNSTVIFHLFVSSCYLTPILGAILGDSVWGKFKTVLYLSILYFLGEVVLTISSVFWNYGAISSGTTFFALFLISIGTGGIKPCVSALGGDQFLDHEEKWCQSFFSLFYGAINLGSLISMSLTPMLRSDFKCVNRSDCYPLAFGVPCALMFVAIVVFLSAKGKYNLVPVPEQNVFVAFSKCIWLASKRKIFGYNQLLQNSAINNDTKNNVSTVSILEQESASSSSSSINSGEDELISTNRLSDTKRQHNSDITKQVTGGRNGMQKHEGAVDLKHNKNTTKKKNKKTHWLYLASDRFDSKSIEDFRAILGILFLFIPFPIYWCLYDQQGSLWTLQANRMDGNLFNTGFVLEPDQIGVINPILILVLIPIFEIFIYPFSGKCGVLSKPIQRMTVGGLILSLAYVSSGLIELRIQKYLPPTQPAPNQANLLLLNGVNECSIVSSVISYNQKPSIEGATNLTTTTTTTTTNLSSQQLTSNPYMLSHTFDILQPFSLQSLILLSSNTTFLDSYQIKFKLTSTVPGSNSSLSLTSIGSDAGCPFSPTMEYGFDLKLLPDKSVRLLYLTQGNGKLDYKMFNETLELPVAGKARVRLLYEAFGSSNQINKRQFSLTRLASIDYNNLNNNSINSKTGEFVFEIEYKDGLVSVSDYLDISVPTKGETFILHTNDPLIGIKENQRILLKPGTRNLIIVHQKDATNFEIKHNLLQDNDYRISMLYQVVPYILISSAEVMFSITGLEFSYAMAPLSMKSVVLGINSLMNSFGNVLVVALESMRLFSNIANEFFFYATIMVFDMILLAVIGYYYKPYNIHGKANK